MTIEVERASVEAELRHGGFELWIELDVTTEEAGRTFSEVLEEMDRPDRPGPVGSLGVRSVDGYVCKVERVGDQAELDTWLQDLVARLQRLGVAGTVRGVRNARYPAWYPNRDPVPTAFMAWSIDDAAVAATPGGMHHWGVSAPATSRIVAHAAGWVRPGGPEILLGRHTFLCRTTDASSIEPVLLDGTSASPSVRVLVYDDHLRRGRAMTMGKGGRMALQHLHRDPTGLRQIDEIREAITALAGDLDLAMVRPARAGQTGWGHIEVMQRLPHRRIDLLFRNRHLLVDHVPDAHGVQVLRDEHLARAADLSGWHITELGDGRHLVEADDLEPWYGSDLPDPEVVERARRDFGAMILTREAIAAHRPPGPP
jgi:hypothetical protein